MIRKEENMINKITFTILTSCLVLASCTNEPKTDAIDTKKQANNIDFLAFGDGGYHVNYPKIKHIKNPRNPTDFVKNLKEDWISDHRPVEEFDHSPLYVYPNTNTTTELGGALAVGKAMASLCETIPCDFGIQLGDNIYPDGADANDGKDDQKRMNDLILAPLQPLFDKKPELVVYSALGNHDWKTSRKGVALQTEWMSKQPNFRLDEQGYYNYKIGEQGNDVEFFVLDTNMLLSGQTFYEVPLNPDGSETPDEVALKNGTAELEEHKRHEVPLNGEDKKQIAWLKNGLKKSTAKWKIVYGHHILWSIGGSKYSEGHVLRRLILPTLCNNADAYIAGHEHDLELLTDDCSLYTNDKTVKKLPLIISGAASKMRGKHTPFSLYQERQYPQYDLVWSKSFTWGFSHITLDNDKDELQVKFYTTPRDRSGELVEETSFSFERRTH